MTHPSESDPSPSSEFERNPVPRVPSQRMEKFHRHVRRRTRCRHGVHDWPLFLAAGVSAFDLLAGLFVGNLLAVLSWTLVCAPVATRFRVTLYYKLEKICGDRLVLFYNVANGLLFCFLAGAMVSVSATAVGVPFHMQMPALDDWAPTSIGWVVTVLIIGAVFAFVAAKGYDAMVRVANVSAPWMVFVFIACGIVALPALGVHSLGEFWSAAQTRIWRGGDPLPGQTKFTFWHVMFFAWFCNAAMHLGMADMSILRYAKKWYHGFSSAAGMFVGHFMAWIAASLLFAVQLAQDPGNLRVAPGPLAYGAVGVAGLICVILAGWTTANPTIYRAGLAFQSLVPGSSRFTVTLVAGGLATAAALFPALAMKLLDFVGLYGTILMPMGAVIVVDTYILPRLNRQSDYAAKRHLAFNPAAGLAWILALVVCLLLNVFAGVQIFFLALPGWIMAGILYAVLSMLFQKTRYELA